MRKINYLLVIIIMLFSCVVCVDASCTTEEYNDIKKQIDEIKITYKHLGEVTLEDGSIVYNKFLVTARGIPEDVYVTLSPLTDNNFIEEDDGSTLKVTLTTGEWHYYMYSSKCKSTIKDIEVKLPRFNMYSLDPLCEGIDGDVFPLCGKYYEYEFSRETFERKVNAYRNANNIGIKDNNADVEEDDLLDIIKNFINQYYVYIITVILLIVVIVIIIIIINRKKRRNILK